MNRVANNRADRRAFTLIEVMLALAVSAIVLVAINAVYFAALKLRNQTSDRIESVRPLEHALDVIEKDLRGVMLPGGTMSGEFQTDAISDSGSLLALAGERIGPELHTCSASVDDTSPFSEIQRVGYFLTSPTNFSEGRDLVRVVSRNLLPSTVEEQFQQRILAGVDRMAFSFHDGTQWQSKWDSVTSSNLPAAIKVEIALHSEHSQRSIQYPVTLVVPVVVEALTNSTEVVEEGAG